VLVDPLEQEASEVAQSVPVGSPGQKLSEAAQWVSVDPQKQNPLGCT
jgi:hypothetical protein